MNKFDKIYLSWRVSIAKPRIIVGELSIDQYKNVNFEYINLDKIRQHEFKGYPGLSIDNSKHKNVLDLFSKRLINTSRTDSKYLLDFWEIGAEHRNDKLYVLAMTQGLTSIDNFEFLAEFKLQNNLHFVTDIAGLSHTKYNLEKLREGDFLDFEKENHEKDKYAIRVLFKGEHLGYIKQVHNRVFYQEGFHVLKAQVKSIVSGSQDRLSKKSLFVRVYV